MKKSRRMQTLVKLARLEEEQAVLRLSEARALYAGQVNRLRELESYHREYTQRMAQLGGTGTDIARLNEYRAFIHQLGEALKIQRQQVAEAREALERQDQSWMEARTHHKALGNYRQRCQREEDLLQAKREQKESDERAMRARSAWQGGR